MLKKVSLTILAFLFPALAFAQPTADFGGIGVTVTNTMQFVNGVIVPLIFAAAFLFFIWGMFKYFIMGGANEESRDQGKQLMLWGVIAFVAMVSIYGLVNVVAEGLGFRDTEIIDIPDIPGPR
jgi:hypothetical protein